MPWRLIVFILVFSVFLAFVTFNLDNRCDVNFGFTVIPGVPVFLTVFISFVFGLVCTLPFIFLRAGKKRVKIPVKDNKDKKEDKDNKMKNNIQERRSIFLKKHGYSPSDGGPDADN